MKTSTALFVACALGLTAAANAQLVVGIDDVTVPMHEGPGDGTWTALFTGADVNGLAADAGTGTLYISTGTQLFTAPLGGPATLVGAITVGGANSSSFNGLAWANGNLYGSRISNTTAAPEGIYQIDPSTGAATLVLGITSADYGFDGFDFDPVTGLFYGSNDDSTPHGSGLFSLDVLGTGAISLVAPYPNGETDIDGLAAGNGVAYLIDDDNSSPNSGPGLFYSYSLNQGPNGAYTSFAAPWTSSEVFSGGAYIPTPGALALLAVGGLMSARRRR